MKLRKKGMISLMDAMIFITILSIAASAIFVYAPNDSHEENAKDIHHDIFETKLKVSDVFDIQDTRVMPLSDLLAAHLTSGEGNIEDYIYKVLDAKIIGKFRFICTSSGKTMILGDGNGVPSSSYAQTMDTPYGKLETSLELF